MKRPLWLALARTLPPETAHAFALRAASLLPRIEIPASPRLETRIGPIPLAHPLGLAAGFDKDAIAVRPLARLGFSFIEIGTVTPRPQRGNPGPRLFRLVEDEALVNRMGFPSAGMEAVARRLAALRRRPAVLGANIGINRDSREPARDYEAVFTRLAPLVDYLVVNVSSPNTPGLRALQHPQQLARILERLQEANRWRRPILVKLAPELEEETLGEIVALAIAREVCGLILTNTTTSRPRGLRSPRAREAGGLSGRPLYPLALARLRSAARHAAGRLTLIGCGGIFEGKEAYAMIRAGASALQLLTALVYRGPGVVRAILADLDRRLAADGFTSLAAAVGADLRSSARLARPQRRTASG